VRRGPVIAVRPDGFLRVDRSQVRRMQGGVVAGESLPDEAAWRTALRAHFGYVVDGRRVTVER
jgi:hypothetical protein